MYKNVIFDFGNVIGRFNPSYIVEQFCDDENDQTLLLAAAFRNWEEVDEGKIEYDEYILSTLKMLPERLKTPAVNFFSYWHKYLPLNEEIVELINRLSKEEDVSLYLLSNASTHFSKSLDYFPFISKFAGTVVSADIKLSKPDKRIYRYLLDKYSLNASECFFVDDLPANIEAASECGIKGYVYDRNITKLQAMLGLTVF